MVVCVLEEKLRRKWIICDRRLKFWKGSTMRILFCFWIHLKPRTSSVSSLNSLKVNSSKSLKMTVILGKQRFERLLSSWCTLCTICTRIGLFTAIWSPRISLSPLMASSNFAILVLLAPCPPTPSFWPLLKELHCTWHRNSYKNCPTTTQLICGLSELSSTNCLSEHPHSTLIQFTRSFTWSWRTLSSSQTTCPPNLNHSCKACSTRRHQRDSRGQNCWHTLSCVRLIKRRKIARLDTNSTPIGLQMSTTPAASKTIKNLLITMQRRRLRESSMRF